MTLAISAGLLSAYYAAQEGLGASSSAPSTAKSTTAPTAPWQSASKAPKQSALVSSVLNGSQFFTAASTQLAAPKGTSSSDYQSLFGLYQGINALQGLAADAAATGVTATQKAAYAAAFTKGMTQLQTYLSKTSFSGLSVNEGTLTASDQTTVGAPVETDTYSTGTIFSGASGAAVPAFSGDVQFAMNLTDTHGAVKTVNFNLADMGDTPRTMANVTAYLNTQLQAAGAVTRFKAVSTPATPVTTTVNGKTVTLSTPPNNYSLQIVGTDTENPTFTATGSTPAVYVTSSSGPAAVAATALTAAVTGDQTQELLKFNAGTSDPSTSLVTTTPLQSAVSSALASATAPDGSVYVLANVNGATADGQTINGSSDVALMKYDSAGQLQYTRTLGASGDASGYSLAVSADGSSVAIAGSVTGALTGNNASLATTTANSFVAAYKANGDQVWSSTQPSTTGSAATGVAFGADGSVYVTGTSTGRMVGSAQDGGTSEFLQSYSTTGAMTSSTQFGSGTAAPAGIVVSGSSVYVAGAEGGNAVVRQFDIQSTGAATAGTTRNLGALQGGAVAGIGVTSDGSVVVAGSTNNGSLSAGTVTSAYQGGEEGFVATLDPSLNPSAGDALAYVDTPGDLKATAMTVSGGQVYLAGTVAVAPPTGSGYTNTKEGYLAAIDPSNGSVTWSQTYQGVQDVAGPTSISVAATGASVLDNLGLPTAITYATSTSLISNTSLTAGDSFYVQAGSGVAQKVTISAADTLQSLEQEIARASGFNAKATTTTVNGETQLKIVPSNSTTTITLSSGPAGADALAALGLKPGAINASVGQTSTAAAATKVDLGLNLSSTMNLNSDAGIATAKTALALASAKIQNAYTSMSSATSKTASASTLSAAAQAANAAKISNYQQALTWLQNNEGSTTATTSLL